MEVNVTEFVKNECAMDYSASIAEIGQNAGQETWLAAMERAEEPLLKTDKEFDAVRDHFREFGAWDDEEIDAWTEQEVNALFIQDVSAAIREFESLVDAGDYDNFDDSLEDENIGGRLFKADIGDNIGDYFFYVGE